MHNIKITSDFINQNTIKSNRVYGEAIYNRDAVEIISDEDVRVEAWVGGLDGKVIDGGGGRRRVVFTFKDSSLKWQRTGNPKNHQIFCKHCVALALYIDKNNVTVK